jgi:hypothetical protein
MIKVNNAAYQMMQQDITDIPNEQWIKTFDTNIHPFFFLSKLLVPHMKRGDTVINCASINAYIGRPDLLDYTSTKGGKFYPLSVNLLLLTLNYSNCIIHPWTCQSTDEERYSRQCGLPRPGMDTLDSQYHG